MNLSENLIEEMEIELDKAYEEYEQRVMKDGFSEEAALKSISIMRKAIKDNKNHPFSAFIDYALSKAISRMYETIEKNKAGETV